MILALQFLARKTDEGDKLGNSMFLSVSGAYED